jgi:hypothetical protein
MRKAFNLAVVFTLAVPVLVIGQSGDVAKILADVRQALGGEQKLSAVKTITATGRNARTRPDGTSTEAEFELLVELPDKYMRRDVLMAMGPTSIYRNAGFNAEGLINLTDAPPALSAGGNIRIAMVGPGGAPGQQLSAEQQADVNKRTLTSYKQDFARLTLGIFASSFSGYPVQFAYAGQAESADGKADVLDVTGEGGFQAKYFIDHISHLPLMISWMDKEPLMLTMGGPGGTRGGGPGVVSIGGGGGGGGSMQTFSRPAGGAPPSKEEIEKMQQEAQDRLKEAEANRKVVEYRLFYAEYKNYDGVRIPTRIQQMVDGTPTQELSFDRIKVNDKIDPKKFEPTKSGSRP